MDEFKEEAGRDNPSPEAAEERSGEAGQGLAEYALILTLIAAVCVVALGSLGGAIASSPGFSMF